MLNKTLPFQCGFFYFTITSLSVKMLREEMKVLGMHSLSLSNVKQPRGNGFLRRKKNSVKV